MKLIHTPGWYVLPLIVFLLAGNPLSAQYAQGAPTSDGLNVNGHERSRRAAKAARKIEANDDNVDLGADSVLAGTPNEDGDLKLEPIPAGPKEPAAKVFPVPAQDVLYVLTDGSTTWAVLMDAGGRIMQQRPLREIRNTLDLTRIPPGMYTLHLVTPQGRESHSVVKR